jgi:hypothetical protein
MDWSFLRTRGFRIGAVVVFTLLLFVYCYRVEIGVVYSTVRAAVLGLPIEGPPERIRHALFVLLYEVAVFVVLFRSMLWLLARFVLPVQTRAQHRGVFGRLLLYVQGQHGPAVFVKDGRLVASREERLKQGAGIALVDPASAIALEHETPPRPLAPASPHRVRDGLGEALYRYEKRLLSDPRLVLKYIGSLLYALRWFSVIPGRRLHRRLLALRLIRPRRPPRPPRVARVEGPGIVFIAPDEKVRETLDLRKQSRRRPGIKGLTRDGIEVETTVNVTFVLDDEQTGQEGWEEETTKRVERNLPAFTFNRRSAFRAVYGSPVRKKTGEGKDEEVKGWMDLPAYVASDIFRDMLSTQTLDNLFRPTSDHEFPLAAFRNDFSRRVQSEPVLKERGIKVLSAGFGGLTLPSAVKDQRISSWQADWTRRSVETLAGGDLQAIRIIQRARANAQYDMVQQINTILQGTDSKAAITLRLLQALETASTDPSTRRLLPAATVNALSNWLTNLRGWLRPEPGAGVQAGRPPGNIP